jgi:hypothetical protein
MYINYGPETDSSNRPQVIGGNGVHDQDSWRQNFLPLFSRLTKKMSIAEAARNRFNETTIREKSLRAHFYPQTVDKM